MKKCLLALDCSPHSEKAAAYLAGVAPYVPGCEVVLFTALTGIPYGVRDITGREEGTGETELHGDLDHRQEQTEASEFQGRIGDLLIAAGLPEGNLQSILQPERRSVAQDIADAALEHGCDTVVVGRRGLSKVRELLGGSVSRELIQKNPSIAVWIIE